jgi:hypothetical protein
MNKIANFSLPRAIAFGLLSLSLVPCAWAQAIQKGQSFEATWSYAGSSAIKRLGARSDSSVKYADYAFNYGFGVGEDAVLSAGLSYSSADFSLDYLNPLPRELTDLSLNLGARYGLDEHWSASLLVSPGYRVAGTKLLAQGLNAPVFLGGSYAASKNLIWVFGAAYDEFSEHPLLPYGGVNWRFAEGWTFSIGFPRTGISYALNEKCTLGLGLTAKGGSYYVKDTPLYATAAVVGGALPSTGLKDTFLDYREVRTGLTAEYKTTLRSSLLVEAGVVTDRKWQYHQAKVNYDGKPAAYGSISLNLSY